MVFGSYMAGEVAETSVIRRLQLMGAGVSVPMSSQKYDLIADFGGTLVKVQVKQARRSVSRGRDSIRASLRGTGNTSYSSDEVDAFAIYLEDDIIFWLWFNEAPETSLWRKEESLKEHKIENKIPQDDWESTVVVS